MSPEQTGGRELDPRSDLFSLGVVIYEALTGQHPFQGEHEMAVLQKILATEPPLPTTIVPSLPAVVDELCTRLLAKAREERPADAAELKTALNALSGLNTGKSQETDIPLQLTYKSTGSEKFRLAIQAHTPCSSGKAGYVPYLWFYQANSGIFIYKEDPFFAVFLCCELYRVLY